MKDRPLKIVLILVILITPFLIMSISGSENLPLEEIIVEKNELTISMNIPSTLNPLTNADTTVDNVLKLIFKPLTTLDENFKPLPNLATQILYTNEENNIVATIILDETATWHDDTPVTAKDFIYSYNILNEAPENAIYKNSVNNIKSCKIIDSNTVEVIFSCNYQNAIYSLDFPLIPEHYYKNNNNSDFEPLGNNYYKFKKYILAETLSLTNIVSGNQINILTIASEDARLSSLKQGITDIDYTTVSNYSKYVNFDFDLIEIPTTYYDFIGFNYENDLFTNIEIRQAVEYMIDKDELLETIYLGYGEVSNSPIHKNSNLSSNIENSNNFSLEKAADIFEDLEISETLEILVNIENLERTNIAETLQQTLRNFNIKSEIIALPFEEYSLEIANKNFDLLVGGYSLSPNFDLAFLLNSSENIFSYHDDLMDTYLENVSNSLGEEFLTENMEILDEYIQNELPIVSLVFRENLIISNPNVNISDFIEL